MTTEHKISKLRNCIKGVAAIEFAILLPFLLIVFFGVYEITTYVITVRKLDNVTNDVAYILSREGCIANGTSQTQDCSNASTFTGGEATLLSIANNAIPFLIYPYAYSSTDGTSQLDVKLVGLPIFSNCDVNSDDGIDRKTPRIMWDELIPLNANVSVSDNIGDVTATQCTGPSCPSVCNNPGLGLYNSFYSDKTGPRANIIYPSQSFILVNFAFSFQPLLGNNFVGIGSIFPPSIEKVASYAARSRWVDGANGNPLDGIIQPGELLNYMQYCTDCDVYSSATQGGNTNMSQSGTGMVNSEAIPFRDICSTTDPNSASGGCTFY